MTPDEAKQAILSMYERLDQGDTGALEELLDDQSTLRQYGPGDSHIGEYSGDAAIDTLLEARSDIEAASRELESVVAEGSTVAVHGKVALDGKDGSRNEGQFAHFFRFRDDGKLELFVDVEPAGYKNYP